MKIIYTNNYTNYTDYIKFINSKLKKISYSVVIVLTLILLWSYFEWFNNGFTDIQLILLNINAIIYIVAFLCVPKMYSIISMKRLTSFISSYKLLSPKELEIKEKKIILTFATGTVNEFTIKDIKGFEKLNNCLYIIRKDTNNALRFMPIIPIDVFENEESKKEFKELLSKK